MMGPPPAAAGTSFFSRSVGGLPMWVLVAGGVGVLLIIATFFAVLNKQELEGTYDLDNTIELDYEFQKGTRYTITAIPDGNQDIQLTVLLYGDYTYTTAEDCFEDSGWGGASEVCEIGPLSSDADAIVTVEGYESSDKNGKVEIRVSER